jgi:hypothetical protein
MMPERGIFMVQKTCNFKELEPNIQEMVLPVFTDHLQEILGPLQGLSGDFNPELVKYFIFKLEPLFTPDGRILKISRKYKKLTRDLYTKIFGGFHHETEEPGTPGFHHETEEPGTPPEIM